MHHFTINKILSGSPTQRENLSDPEFQTQMARNVAKCCQTGVSQSERCQISISQSEHCQVNIDQPERCRSIAVIAAAHTNGALKFCVLLAETEVGEFSKVASASRWGAAWSNGQTAGLETRGSRLALTTRYDLNLEPGYQSNNLRPRFVIASLLVSDQ